MNKDNIILSEKYGLNPSISVCLLCGKDIGIALFGKLEEDKEAPKKCCTGELCDDCRNKLIFSKEIVIFDNTGRYILISEEYFNPKILELVNKSRVLLVTSEEFDNIIGYENN